MPKFFEEYKNKKIALCFFGISYKENYDHWMADWFNGVDWRQNNYRETLFHLLDESNHSVDVFFSTYNSPLNQELLMDLKPKNMVFNDFVAHPSDEDIKKYDIHPLDRMPHAFIQRNRRFKEVINLVPKDEYDFIIMIRFDLHLLEQLAIIDVDTQSLNVSSRWCNGEHCFDDQGRPQQICDNFYIIPKGVVEDFVNFIESIPDDYSYHHLHQDVDDKNNHHRQSTDCPDINFMIEGNYWSHTCPVYGIMRVSLPRQQNNNIVGIIVNPTPSPPSPPSPPSLMTPKIKSLARRQALQAKRQALQAKRQALQARISNHRTIQTHKKRTQTTAFKPKLNNPTRRTRRKIR